MAYRTSTVCIMAILLFSFTLTYAARPEPAFADVTPMETLYGVYMLVFHQLACGLLAFS
jgi:hypothetical protein